MAKMVVDPGEYACTWNLDGTTYPGVIEFRQGARTRGEIYDTPLRGRENESGEVINWFPSSEELASLTGELRNGQAFILEGVRVEHWFMQRALVFADTAICGLCLDVTRPFKCETIEFQTGGLTELSGAVPLRTTSPFGDSPKVFKIEWREEADQIWTSGSDQIALRFHARYRPADLYSFSISTSPIVEVKGRSRSIGEWNEEFVGAVRNLASISTGVEQSVRWLIAKRTVQESHADGTPRTWEAPAQVFSPNITQEHYEAERPDQPSVSIIELVRTGSSLTDLIERWNTGASQYVTFFELFRSVFGEGTTLRAAFLALVPALESLHGQKYGNGEVSVEEHKSRRRAVLDALKKLGLSAADYRWLRRWVDSRGGYSLAERLRQLYHSIDEELRETIDSKINPIPSALGSIHENPADIWDVISRLRNDLAHGGASRSPGQIGAAVRLCHTIATALVLEELAVSKLNLRLAIERELWRVV